MIKAIETVYKGYKFRSRLEARWAVFFDCMGYTWKYEPEGFKTNDTLYLPDFYLPDFHTWVEVKGSNEALQKCISSIIDILDWESPIPHIEWSFDDESDKAPGLLLLGDIPNYEYLESKDIGTFYGHPILQHYKGVVMSHLVFFSRTKLDVYKKDYKLVDSSPELVKLDTILLQYDNTSYANNTFTSQAYKYARQARFEHGAKG
jgi:hypothetical protein